jgi:nucleotide-binding universal stress UspA family protein
MTYPSTWNVEIEAAEALDKKHRREMCEALDGLRTTVLLDDGDMESSLQAAFKKYDIDLLVMGTRGRGGLAKAALGSVAEELLRSVSCPVLTVGPHAEAVKSKFRSILFAMDLSSEATPAAEYAFSLAQECQASIALLRVVEGRAHGDGVTWAKTQDVCKSALLRLIPQDAEAWCKVDCFVERGDPAERILELAMLRKSDLIVLGAKPERGFPGAATHLPISTVHKVVAKAHCPVLTVRTE